MTTPDIRTALERLVKTDDGCSAAEWSDAIAAARAALAEPEPPSDKEVAELVRRLRDWRAAPLLQDRERAANLLERLAKPEPDGPAVPEGREPASVDEDPTDADLLERLAPQPVMEGPTNQDILDLYHAVFFGRLHGPPSNSSCEVDFARAVLARWGRK